MTKKWFTMFVLLVALVALLAMTADASRRPYDQRVEKAKQAKVHLALDDGSADMSGRNQGSISLGAANPAINSRGALIANTWHDWHANATICRVVDDNPASSGLPMVQFAYHSKASGLAANLSRWGYNAYEASTGSFLYPGGTVIVQSPVDADQEVGRYPKIHIQPNGRAIIGAYDFPQGTGNPSQMHVVWDDGPGAANFGDINAGSVMSEAVRGQGSLEGALVIWPGMAVTEFGGTPIIYLCGYENAGGNGAVKVYRKVGTVAANPDATWSVVFTDTSFFPTTDIACDPTSSKVACTWTKGTVNSVGDDVWMAESPTGLAGTWTRTNITHYLGAGYRAWLEATCMYDTQGKFHVIWNGGTSDGFSSAARSCRLFHWSQWNPANIYTMYAAEWDPGVTDCYGASNVLNVGKFSFGECDGRIYGVFCSWNDPTLTAAQDDCCKSAPIGQGANGEYYLVVSKDLQGKSWDAPRNLTNSYTPACDTGTCADDRWGGMSLYGTDDALFAGTETWPTAATYDPSGSYAGTKYIQFEYITDRYPGGAVLSTPQGPWTNNDVRWIRLACVQPITAAALAASPGLIGFPEFAKPGVQKDLTLTLENTGNTTLTFGSISPVYDSSKPAGLTNWMGITGTPATIAEASSATATFQLNKAGIVTGQPKQAWGRMIFTYSGGAAVNKTYELSVELVVADTVVHTKWDTLNTACTKLTMSSNGNMGHAGLGNVNMNFTTPLDCDTGANSRGDADIYLYDGSPIVVRKTGATSWVASWAIFSDGFESDNGFKPLVGFAPSGKNTSNAKWDIYKSGTFCTIDSLVKIEKTWYAPKGFADSCKFILQQMRVFPYTIGSSVTGLAIGEAIDWDVPSDSGSSNFGGDDWAARKLIWQRGYNMTDTITDCRNNSLRYSGMGVLFMHMKDCASVTPFGGYTASNSVYVYPASTFVPSELWANMQVSGASNPGTTEDLHSVLTYRNTASTGYTLPANDTLTIWTALITIPNATTTAAGVDSLKKEYDKAQKFGQNWSKQSGWDLCWSSGCCVQPTRGNVNQLGIIDLSDLSLLIAYLTATPKPTLPCPAAANVNGTGIIDLSDLSLLIAYLTATPKPTLPPCGNP